ncbi:MAG: hypothetical protein U0992_01465 [Planctomycetaceae bacterium]
MKRWITNLTIAGYLGALALGLLSHAVMYYSHKNPLMYLIVWDMYCGWSAFESRLHVLAETYGGEHYEVLPAPWGEFHPYQGPSRRHYDTRTLVVPRMAELVLEHTEHEPIRRLIVVEEAWSKKFNLPDELWALRHNEPKDKHSYYHVRCVKDLDTGEVSRGNEWVNALANEMLKDNPRLMADVKRGHTFFAVDPSLKEAYGNGVTPAGYSVPQPGSP